MSTNLPKGVKVSEASFMFEQDGDSCQNQEVYGNGQFLEVRLEDAGGGPFIVLKTERWSVDSIRDFSDLLNWVNEQISKPEEKP